MKKLLLLLCVTTALVCGATDYPGHPGFVGKIVYVNEDGFPVGEPGQNPNNFEFAYCFEYGYLAGYDTPVAIMLSTQYEVDETGIFPMPSYYNIVDPDHGTLMCKVIGIDADNLFWVSTSGSAVTSVTLPSELEFVVGDGALSFPSITSLTLPASLEYLDVKALNKCTMLTDLTVADSNKPLNILGTQSNNYGPIGAFGVPPLVNAYVGKNVISEQDSPFKRSSNSTSLKHVTLAGNGQVVYDKMFYQQDKLETAVLKEGVGDIGSQAFSGCRALTGIEIPSTTTIIGSNAFSEDTVMTAVTLNEGLKYIGKNAFYNCRKVGELYLPASLDSICSDAFTFMYGVTKVTIADSDRALAFNHKRYWGNGAFDHFTSYTAHLGRDIELTDEAPSPFYSGGTCSLTALTIGNQVTTLPENAFSNNRRLATATIGTGLTSIPKQAFSECTGLTGISIPGNVKRIEQEAFTNDTAMTTATLHEGLKYIGKNAFYKCSKVGEIYLPASLDSIYSDAFTMMYGVTKVTIADTNRALAFNHKRYWGNGAFDHFDSYTAHLGRVIELTDEAPSPFYSGGSRSLTALTIGNQVTMLPEQAFSNNHRLATATIGTGLTAIPKNAFSECTGLTGISIPGNVKRIEQDAFNNDTAMTTATLHEGLKYIGKNAFYKCSKVGELYLPATLDSIHSDSFTMMYGVTKVTIADSNRALAFNHKRYWGNGAFDHFDSYTAHLGRDIELTDEAPSPFYSGGTRSLTALTIGNQVSTLPEQAFSNNSQLATATIGTGLTAIPKRAFSECRSLTGISIPGNVERIEQEAFTNDTVMTAVTLNEGLKYIGNNAFYSCGKVGELYLPASLDSIHSAAFTFMRGVQKLTIADSDQPLTFNHNRYWTNGAFNEMPLTTSLYIGRDLTVTDQAVSPIYRVQTVKNITLGEQVTAVLDNQFYYNTGLRNLTVNAVEPPACPDNAFNGVNIDNITLAVPAGSKSKYRVAPVWERFFNGEEVHGDVNGDGEITVGDVSAIYDIMLGLSDYNPAADVNGDGEITVGDVSALYNIMLGV